MWCRMLTNHEVLQSKRETITDNMNKSMDERKIRAGKQDNTNVLIDISVPHNNHLEEKCYEKITKFYPRQKYSKRGIKRSAH